MAWLLQKEIRKTEYQLARSRGRGAMFWVDRWRPKEPRPDELRHPPNPAQATKHLEGDQYQESQGAYEARLDAPVRAAGVSVAHERKIGNLFLRTKAKRQAQPRYENKL